MLVAALPIRLPISKTSVSSSLHKNKKIRLHLPKVNWKRKKLGIIFFFSLKQGNMEARIRGENYKYKDSHGDIRLSISNSTSVSTLNTCKDVGRLPSGSQHKDRSGWENQNCSTGTGIPLQAALSKSWWWGVHPRWECHWLENSPVYRALEGEDM